MYQADDVIYDTDSQDQFIFVINCSRSAHCQKHRWHVEKQASGRQDLKVTIKTIVIFSDKVFEVVMQLCD